MPRLTCDRVATRHLVALYVADRLGPETLGEFEAHLLTCDRCQDEVRLALALRTELPEPMADASVLEGTARDRRRWPRAVVGRGLAAAAALLLVLALPRFVNRPDGPPDHRAPQTTDAPSALAPKPLAPVGTVESVASLVWSRAAGASRYRVTLLDENGSVVWESETPDTTVAIPADVGLADGIAYFWKVDARFGFQRWLSSDLVEFRLLSSADHGQPSEGSLD